jgi:hypothetical protein
MLYLCTAVLDDQVAQGNAVRNVARLVDRIAGEAGEMRTLTEREMFRILDHECRDRHLWMRDADAPTPGSDRGDRDDRGVAGACERSVHAVGLRA